jgi:hypothetical protein
MSPFSSNHAKRHAVAADVRWLPALTTARPQAPSMAEPRKLCRPGLPAIYGFVSRRFAPAVAACGTAAPRMHGRARGIAGTLPSRRVDIACERRSQALLASMDCH